MSHHEPAGQQTWWKLVLTGVLAIAFGAAAVVLPAGILSIRILDVIFRLDKRFSGSMTALAALLALVAVVALDGFVHLLGPGVVGKRASRIRGVAGLAVASAAIFWPDWTVVAAVKLIGIWAILVGVLELLGVRHFSENAKRRALRIFAAIASIAIGVGIMKELFVGAVVVSAAVGVAAAARGISMIALGVSHRLQRGNRHEEPAIKTERDQEVGPPPRAEGEV